MTEQQEKERFNGLYAGQKIRVVKTERWTGSRLEFVEQRVSAGTGLGGYLELKPLSAISDEDAVIVASIIHKEGSIMDSLMKILNGEKSDNHPFELESIEKINYDSYDEKDYYHTDVNTIGDIVSTVRIYDDGEIRVYDEKGNDYEDMSSLIKFLNAWDYLRSCGYALPWLGISVEEQIKRGWVKLIE